MQSKKARSSSSSGSVMKFGIRCWPGSIGCSSCASFIRGDAGAGAERPRNSAVVIFCCRLFALLSTDGAPGGTGVLVGAPVVVADAVQGSDAPGRTTSSVVVDVVVVGGGGDGPVHAAAWLVISATWNDRPHSGHCSSRLPR